MALQWIRMKLGRGNLTWSRMWMSPVSWRPGEVELIQLVLQVQQHPRWSDNAALRHFIMRYSTKVCVLASSSLPSKLSLLVFTSASLPLHLSPRGCLLLVFFSSSDLPRQSNRVFGVSVHQPHLNAAAIIQKSSQMLFCIRSNPKTKRESKCPFFYLSLSSA